MEAPAPDTLQYIEYSIHFNLLNIYHTVSSVWMSVNNEVLSVEIQPTFGGEHVAPIFKVEEQTKEETSMK
jgi:hypothetical protein